MLSKHSATKLHLEFSLMVLGQFILDWNFLELSCFSSYTVGLLLIWPSYILVGLITVCFFMPFAVFFSTYSAHVQQIK